MYKKPRHDPVFGESSANRAQADKFHDSLRAMLDSYEDPVCAPGDEQSHKASQIDHAKFRAKCLRQQPRIHEDTLAEEMARKAAVSKGEISRIEANLEEAYMALRACLHDCDIDTVAEHIQAFEMATPGRTLIARPRVYGHDLGPVYD